MGDAKSPRKSEGGCGGTQAFAAADQAWLEHPQNVVPQLGREGEPRLIGREGETAKSARVQPHCTGTSTCIVSAASVAGVAGDTATCDSTCTGAYRCICVCVCAVPVLTLCGLRPSTGRNQQHGSDGVLRARGQPVVLRPRPHVWCQTGRPPRVEPIAKPCVLYQV